LTFAIEQTKYNRFKDFEFPGEPLKWPFFKEAKQMQIQAQFFVGLGTLSLINAGLAQSKGRSGFLWWLLSLFLGPIATFLIVVLPADSVK